MSSRVSPKSIMRPRLRTLLTLLLLAGTVLGLGAGSEARADQRPAKFVDVIQVRGYIDPVTVSFIRRSIEASVRDKAEAIVIQLDSSGALLSQTALDALEFRLKHETRVPVIVWVGEAGARATHGAVRLVRAAQLVGVAPGTHIGQSTPTIVGTDPLQFKTINAKQALADGTAQLNSPILGLLVAELDGRTVNGKVLDTAKAVVTNGKPSLSPYGVRFARLTAFDQLLHTVTNPTVAYLLLTIALALFIFEFYTGGIGVAAAVGLGSFVFAAYGLGLLPTRGWAIALIALAGFGFAVDVQAGVPRFWTAVATVAFVAGSLTLYRGDVHVPLYWIAVMSIMLVLFMVNGMPSMVRTRFATPTVGRESMIGAIGTARDTVGPEGVVMVADAPWRARTNRATPIPAGDPIKVVAIDGLLLEVEPLEGAAKDAGH